MDFNDMIGGGNLPYLSESKFNTDYELDPPSSLDPSLVVQHFPISPSPKLPPPATGNAGSGLDLLDFRMCPISTHRIFNSAHTPQFINIGAQLSGMFFLAQSPWESNAMSNLEPPTLTCYRRNLFNISGTIDVPRDVATVVGPKGHEDKVDCLSVDISATESLAGSSIMLVSAPPKQAAKSSSTTNISPNPIKLDLEGNSNQYADPCPFPVFWNRLQFRTATAKNNRRAALQQYYSITINVLATLADGSKIVVCKATSLPIIVRGRSPGRYQMTKTGAPELESTMAENVDVLETTYATIDQNSGIENLSTPPSHHEQLHAEAEGSEVDETLPAVSKLPISQDGCRKSSSMAGKSLLKTVDTTPNDSKGLPALQSNAVSIDSSNLSYEYFPLSINDWTPPVEAVYRPHAFHHMRIEQGQKHGSKKRYYIE